MAQKFSFFYRFFCSRISDRSLTGTILADGPHHTLLKISWIDHWARNFWFFQDFMLSIAMNSISLFVVLCLSLVIPFGQGQLQEMVWNLDCLHWFFPLLWLRLWMVHFLFLASQFWLARTGTFLFCGEMLQVCRLRLACHCSAPTSSFASALLWSQRLEPDLRSFLDKWDLWWLGLPNSISSMDHRHSTYSFSSRNPPKSFSLKMQTRWKWFAMIICLAFPWIFGFQWLLFESYALPWLQDCSFC